MLFRDIRLLLTKEFLSSFLSIKSVAMEDTTTNSIDKLREAELKRLSCRSHYLAVSSLIFMLTPIAVKIITLTIIILNQSKILLKPGLIFTIMSLIDRYLLIKRKIRVG